MLELVLNGGLMIWVILAAALVAATIFLERLFHLHRAAINSSDFLEGIYNVLRRRNTVEAVSICEETPGPVAHIMRIAILKGHETQEDIQRAVELAGLAEIPRLERNMPMLATIAHVTPLFGLLGTVIGMMEVFLVMNQKAPLIHAGDLSGGIWQALITTAFGLAVAIPAYVAYNFLVTRIEAIVLDMERASVEIVNFLTQSTIRAEVERS